jgi:hypothetical protein
MRNKISTMQKNKGSVTLVLALILILALVYFLFIRVHKTNYNMDCLSEKAQEICHRAYSTYKTDSIEFTDKSLSDAKFKCLNAGVEELEYFTIKELKYCEVN